MNKKAGMGGGDEAAESSLADANKRNDKGMMQAVGSQGEDVKPETATAAKTQGSEISIESNQYEVLPELSVEQIDESNRKITKVTVRKNQKETVFSKVIYTWGGVYYFRHNVSISESLYFMSTGMR